MLWSGEAFKGTMVITSQHAHVLRVGLSSHCKEIQPEEKACAVIANLLQYSDLPGECASLAASGDVIGYGQPASRLQRGAGVTIQLVSSSSWF